MGLSKLILRMVGWTVKCTVPDFPKSIICVAPHTSNWDFILGKLAYASLGRQAGFLMKSSWFFFPLGYIFKAMGGIPVNRKAHTDMTTSLIEKFNNSSQLNIAITPEGTRSLTKKWHTGFLRIANGANVPVILGVIDSASRSLLLERVFIPTGDIDADLMAIKNYYKPFAGIHPDKFSAE